MENRILTLCLMFLMVNLSKAQTFNYPSVNKSTASELKIKSVIQGASFTQIDFVYQNNTDEDVSIYLLPPGNEDAFFIKANGKIYNLLFFQNINLKDRSTIVGSRKEHSFFARFERLAEDVSIFDLIEGKNGPWDFYGVRIKGSPATNQEIKRVKFRKDYNHVAFFDPEKNSWGEWDLADHTFIFNHNDRGDIMFPVLCDGTPKLIFHDS
ncbi:hypothetical protein [Cognataquiflexum rubidum]|uniref:hypothetical protein n=1 Tax=Cognataquiflexum rubidum TaxID=2922273 RepID=UPI001F148EDE|nr:hypothetical protein [Cognataquiflexum rubidum]MCH6236564.1 hypothetical protein [Cognataquiflexum rubidum]